MLLQKLTERLAEDAHAAAVDDANARESGEEGAIYEAFDHSTGIVYGLSDYVDFAGYVGAFAFERD